MKLKIIVGSISKKSNNMKIAKFIENKYKDKLDIEILDIKEMPMYNEDIELDPPQVVLDIKKSAKEADGIIFVTPEYNHSIPGVLKNTLDWFSRVERPIANKPTMILGASTGSLGTVRSQTHLRQVLNSGGVAAINLPGNEVFISNVEDKLDKQGKLIHEATIEYIDKTIDNFINWIKKVK